MKQHILRIILVLLVTAPLGARDKTDPFVFPKREIASQYGITMQPDSTIRWMSDGKIGLFVHWGLYSGPGYGEWLMENKGIPPEEYRKLAYPEAGEEYFDAADFDAGEITALAKRLGARYITFTSQHHDGYALFDSKYMNSFTSVQTLNRDFTREFVDACRAAGLRVGLYKTLINWRYPGYYDWTGTDCKRNKFGYTTDPSHKENARLLKEELYANTRQLITEYGKIDLIFWDGGWLGQTRHDADAAFFWEPGMYLDPSNEWPVNPYFTEKDENGRALGLMGMVRKYQKDVVTNSRCGWIGDFGNEEGVGEVTGPIRNGVVEKCFAIAPTLGQTDILRHPAWGYSKSMEDPSLVMPLEDMKRIFADCMMRNIVYCINLGPDRHGRIPAPINDRLSALGEWIAARSEAVYGTVGGPWQPANGKYGFCHKGNVIYVWLQAGTAYSSFTLPQLRKGLKVKNVRKVGGEGRVRFSQSGTRVRLSGLGIDGSDITVLAVELDKEI